ncbi:MAG: hypothetical protein M1816_006258 [Peltula sp. TS41687]|nr:MAG: hypothetical protein M1816_006258 [Peltula sp. TS41687]
MSSEQQPQQQQEQQQQQQQDAYHAALSRNANWCERICSEDPDLFPQLASGQKPEILWLGCSDSRCPETTILDLKPGDVFVHRNIANVMHPGDLSAQSVIEFAVKYLKVNHVVLCGHSSCGGVNAALANTKLGLIDAWLLPLRMLREQHLAELERCQDDKERTKMLVELNVKYGVKVLKGNHHIIDAMKERGLEVHGCVYDIASGKLQEVETAESSEEGEKRLRAFETK